MNIIRRVSQYLHCTQVTANGEVVHTPKETIQGLIILSEITGEVVLIVSEMSDDHVVNVFVETKGPKLEQTEIDSDNQWQLISIRKESVDEKRQD